MTVAATLTLVTCMGQDASQALSDVVARVQRDNRSCGLTVEPVDVDAEAERVRQLGLLEYPALVLHVSGRERGRLLGLQSRRAVLQMLLPELYPEDQALAQLQQQLDSPGEQFPRRALRRHERVGVAARTEMLANVELFAGLTRRQLRAIARSADELVIDPGTTLTEEGAAGDSFYVVAAGELEVSRAGTDLATLGAGDCFGEMSLLDGLPRSATVVTRGDCVLLALDRLTFTALVRANPDMAMGLLASISRRLRDADEALS